MSDVSATLSAAHLLLSVGYRREIIIGFINILVANIIGRRIAFLKPITYNDIIMSVTSAIACLLVFTFFNMIVIKIGEVMRKLPEMTV